MQTAGICCGSVKSGTHRRRSSEKYVSKASLRANEMELHMSELIPASLSNAAGKSLFIFGSVVTISDFCQPLAPVASYALILSFMSLLLFIGIFLFSKNRYKAESKYNNTPHSYFTITGLVTSILVLACSAFLVFQQQKNPQVNDYGLIASNIPFLKDLQASVMNIEKSLGAIEQNTGATAENTGKAAEVLLSTENLAEAIKLGDIAVFNTFVKEGKRFPARAYAETL